MDYKKEFINGIIKEYKYKIKCLTNAEEEARKNGREISYKDTIKLYSDTVKILEEVKEC